MRRVTQLPVEAAYTGDPDARLSQIVVEVLADYVPVEDEATVYVELTPATAYMDDAEVLVTLWVLGGECHSTWSAGNLGFSEASLRWIARASTRWTAEASTRWSPGTIESGDLIHC